MGWWKKVRLGYAHASLEGIGYSLELKPFWDLTTASLNLLHHALILGELVAHKLDSALKHKAL